MSTNQSVFSFELDESLYFERGQEVAEIMGISLEPEISIQSFNEYISIRGIVELQGEYKKAENLLPAEEDDVSFFNDFHSKRYIENVEDLEDGYLRFSHRFPVEISVPTYRIEDIDNVTVNIATFDYEIPDENQLRLKSTIEIYGINDQINNSILEGQSDPREDPKNDTGEQRVDEDEMEETFEFEIKKRNETESVNESLSETTESVSSIDGMNPTIEKSEEGDDRWKYKTSQSFAEFFKKDQKPADISPESPESTSESLSPANHEAVETWNELSPEFVNEDESSSIVSRESMEHIESNGESVDSKRETVRQEEKESIDVSDKADDISRLEIQESTENLEMPQDITKQEQVESIESQALMESSDPHEDPPERQSSLGFLSDMIRDNEENYTKMRLCIVQENDTLETIAERYQTTSMHIAKKNRLEGNHISTGQILYIPSKKKHKS